MGCFLLSSSCSFCPATFIFVTCYGLMPPAFKVFFLVQIFCFACTGVLCLMFSVFSWLCFYIFFSL